MIAVNHMLELGAVITWVYARHYSFSTGDQHDFILAFNFSKLELVSKFVDVSVYRDLILPFLRTTLEIGAEI